MANQPKVSASITAQNTFTDGLLVQGKKTARISGTFSATVSLQYSEDGSNWNDAYDNTGTVVTFTTPARFIIEEPAQGIFYRLGVKTGNFTSGTVAVAIFG